jgi:hypothetical protein
MFADQEVAVQGVNLAPGAKSTVVPSKPIPSTAAMRILGGHHLPAFEASPEGRQGAPQLERGGDPARQSRAGCTAPRLYLGEINSTQERACRRSIEVMEAGTAQPRTLLLFAEDRCWRHCWR